MIAGKCFFGKFFINCSPAATEAGIVTRRNGTRPCGTTTQRPGKNRIIHPNGPERTRNRGSGCRPVHRDQPIPGLFETATLHPRDEVLLVPERIKSLLGGGFQEPVGPPSGGPRRKADRPTCNPVISKALRGNHQA